MLTYVSIHTYSHIHKHKKQTWQPSPKGSAFTKKSGTESDQKNTAEEVIDLDSDNIPILSSARKKGRKTPAKPTKGGTDRKKQSHAKSRTDSADGEDYQIEIDSESDNEDFEETPRRKPPKNAPKSAGKKTPTARSGQNKVNGAGRTPQSAGKKGANADGGGEIGGDVYLCEKGCGFEGLFDDVAAHETMCMYVRKLEWDDNMDEEDEEEFLRK